MRAERGEKIARGKQSTGLRRAPIEIHGQPRGDKGEHTGKHAALRVSLLEDRIRKRAAGIPRGPPFFETSTPVIRIVKFRSPPRHPIQLHQPLRISHRQGAQHDGVDQTEDGGIGADAEGQRDHGNGGETGALAQHAHAVADILKQTFHGDPPAEQRFTRIQAIEVMAIRLPIAGER